METADLSSMGSDSRLAGSAEELIDKEALPYPLLLFQLHVVG